jgi:single-strand DNA-binding protein
MSELVSVTGLVATTPRHIVSADGLPITSFRLASSYRKFDRDKMRWVDGETNWYTITAFRTLAMNTASSISKGERIFVYGKLNIRDWDNGERSGTSVEIEALTLGHDLCWGTSTMIRTTLVRETGDSETASDYEPLDVDDILGVV